MSLVETLHVSEQQRQNAAHKERQARIAARAYRPHPVMQRADRVTVPSASIATPPRYLVDAEYEAAWATAMLLTDDERPETGPVPIETIQRVVCEHFKVSRADVLSARRTANLIVPRHIIFYLCKRLTLRSLPEIGRRCGGRDHTTALHGIRSIEKRAAADFALRDVLDRLIVRLGGADQSEKRKSGKCKLNEDAVRKIRTSSEPDLAALAKEYGVTRYTVWGIIERKTWRHVA